MLVFEIVVVSYCYLPAKENKYVYGQVSAAVITKFAKHRAKFFMQTYYFLQNVAT